MKIFLFIIFGIIGLILAAPFIFVFEIIFIRAFSFLFVIAIFFIIIYFAYGGFNQNETTEDELDVILKEFYKYKKNSVYFSRVENFFKKCSSELKHNNKRINSIQNISTSLSRFEQLSSLDKLNLTIEETSLKKRNELIIQKATSVLQMIMNEGESVDLQELDAILSKIFKN